VFAFVPSSDIPSLFSLYHGPLLRSPPPYNSMIIVVVYPSHSFLLARYPPPSLPLRQFRTEYRQYGNIYHISHFGIGRADTFFLYPIFFYSYLYCAQRVQFIIRERVCVCVKDPEPVAPSSRFLVVGSWRLPTTDKLSLAEVRWLWNREWRNTRKGYDGWIFQILNTLDIAYFHFSFSFFEGRVEGMEGRGAGCC